VATITVDTSIDELLELLPESNGYLIEQGLPCLVCGEPFWGTIGSLAEKHGVEDVDRIIRELAGMLDAKASSQ